jgi:hypothetical protein
MNQVSSIGFGVDAAKLAGYAQSINDRLGNFDLVVENTGDNTLYMMVREQKAGATTSGYADVGSWFTVVPKGVQTKSYCLVSKRVGFFGSGRNSSAVASATKANVSVVLRNKADLRGAGIDIVTMGRRGWGVDEAFDAPTLTKKWGAPPDSTSTVFNRGAAGGGFEPTPA